MKVVLATGIYPPDIGGPATYVPSLAHQLVEEGVEVEVITYGKQSEIRNTKNDQQSTLWNVQYVSRSGGPLFRWLRYAKKFRQCAKDSDIIYVFSSVSVGIPLTLSRIRTPTKILRLGGDFFWERYTDRGGVKGLREWYESGGIINSLNRCFAQWILKQFHCIIFSTAFQKEMYEQYYRSLPRHCVIDNAISVSGPVQEHLRHDPLRLLFIGRITPVKNLRALIDAVQSMPDMLLTIVGGGPTKHDLQAQVGRLHLASRIFFLPPTYGEEKRGIMDNHDLLVLPSLTEVSPQIALEAQSSGLPVLLTTENGLPNEQTEGMIRADLQTSDDIVREIENIKLAYPKVSLKTSRVRMKRSWNDVAKEHLQLFHTFI